MLKGVTKSTLEFDHLNVWFCINNDRILYHKCIKSNYGLKKPIMSQRNKTL